MKNFLLSITIIGCYMTLSSCSIKPHNNTAKPIAHSQTLIQNDSNEDKILVFSKTNGWRHKSIPSGIAALKKMGLENNWHIDATEDSLQFNYENLKKYKTLVFVNTTGDILNSQQEQAFKRYINEGGGFVGIHSASDTEHDWPFYAQLIGGHFKSHPAQQTATLKVHKENNHPSIAHYGDSFQKFDEWYNFKKPVVSHVNVLLELDESSYTGERMGIKHPIAWYHHFEGGRIFFTGMGHTNETFEDANFLKHLKEGILWALHKTHVALNEKGENLLDKDLKKWDVWMGGVHTSVDLDVEKSKDVKTGKPLGLNNDPKKVFSIIEEDGEEILKITGEIYGGLTTKNEYRNYHFKTQFKWGDKKWEPRLNDKRDSGILYHAKGPHGAFWNVWMASLEFQVQEGDCGDFIALGNVYGDVPAERKVRSNGSPYFVYSPTGKNTPLKWDTGFESGQASKSILNENPNGQWNTLEIYCLENESIHLVNGKVVNRVKNARYNVAGKTIPVNEGKIQIQSEAAEVYYKNMTITPINNFPKKFHKL